MTFVPLLIAVFKKVYILICLFVFCSIREGGCATGFRHVEPTEYIPRLLRFNGKRKNITISEVQKLTSHNWNAALLLYFIWRLLRAGALHACASGQWWRVHLWWRTADLPMERKRCKQRRTLQGKTSQLSRTSTRFCTNVLSNWKASKSLHLKWKVTGF